MAIPDGTYRATLENVRLFPGFMNEMCAQFYWRIAQFDCVKPQILSSVRSDGGPAIALFAALRNWAPDFPADGNFKWFANNLERCSQYPVEIEIKNDKVDWVTRAADASDAPRTTGCSTNPPPSRPPIPLVCHKDRLAVMPDSVERTGSAVYTLFRELTEGSEIINQNRVWIDLAANFGPHQLEFTEDDWRRMETLISSLVSQSDDEGNLKYYPTH